jgi:DNA repair photolyase
VNDFTQDRTGHGTQEWAEINANIQQGCSNGCLYCYARTNALRFGKIQHRTEWLEEKIDWAAVGKPWTKRKGVIMFPTAHDITMTNLEAVVKFLANVLAPGNQVLIVSKPDVDCIIEICKSFRSVKSQILFRFTIGTTDDELAKFREPGAPWPIERITALEHAHGQGFQTSVSMEPMLGGTDMAIMTYRAVEPFVTETIWIGKMNKMRSRIKMTPVNTKAVERIERLQDDASILRLVDALGKEPKVRWKDSIKEVIAKQG